MSTTYRKKLRGGGVENTYVYPPDGVNDVDLDGEAAFLVPAAIFIGRIIVQQTAKQAVKQGLKQLAVNQVKGKAAEKAAVGIARVAYPLHKIKTQVGFGTPHGRRVVDILLQNRFTGSYKNIEVKSGSSRYLKGQRDKDKWLNTSKGYQSKLWRF